MLKITASSRFHTIHPDGKFTPTEMAEQFHKVGFEGFDFDMNEYSDNWDPDTREATIGELAETAARLNLSVNMCHLPFYKKDDVRTTDRELNRKLIMAGIDGAALLGVENGVIHPNALIMKKEQYDSEECFKKTVEYLTPFAEYAQKKGVRLSIENMCNYKSSDGLYRYCSFPEELIRVADWFGAGICWDFGHANSVDIAQGDALRMIGKRLTALHVNDNTGKKDDHLFPFYGTVNWKDAMQGLRDSGYSGVFNYECRTQRLPAVMRDEVAAYAIALAKKLQNY